MFSVCLFHVASGCLNIFISPASSEQPPPGPLKLNNCSYKLDFSPCGWSVRYSSNSNIDLYTILPDLLVLFLNEYTAYKYLNIIYSRISSSVRQSTCQYSCHSRKGKRDLSFQALKRPPEAHQSVMGLNRGMRGQQYYLKAPYYQHIPVQMVSKTQELCHYKALILPSLSWHSLE